MDTEWKDEILNTWKEEDAPFFYIRMNKNPIPSYHYLLYLSVRAGAWFVNIAKLFYEILKMKHSVTKESIKVFVYERVSSFWSNKIANKENAKHMWHSICLSLKSDINNWKLIDWLEHADQKAISRKQYENPELFKRLVTRVRWW